MIDVFSRKVLIENNWKDVELSSFLRKAYVILLISCRNIFNNITWSNMTNGSPIVQFIETVNGNSKKYSHPTMEN